MDKRRLLEVEEQKRRAEQDKLAAITELQYRSQVRASSFQRASDPQRETEWSCLVAAGDLPTIDVNPAIPLTTPIHPDSPFTRFIS